MAETVYPDPEEPWMYPPSDRPLIAEARTNSPRSPNGASLTRMHLPVPLSHVRSLTATMALR